jgi:hypothetical protein
MELAALTSVVLENTFDGTMFLITCQSWICIEKLSDFPIMMVTLPDKAGKSPNLAPSIGSFERTRKEKPISF